MLVDKIEINLNDSSWEIACKIINAECEYKNFLGQKTIDSVFSKDEIRKIGEHLINFVKTEEESEG